MHVQAIDMALAGKDNCSFAVQLMSGLMSDVDTANAVLNHTSTSLFQRIKNNGIDSLFDSKLLDCQLDAVHRCLQYLSGHQDSCSAKSCDGSGNSSTEQSTNVSDVCTNLLVSLCCPLLDHLMASGGSSDCYHRIVERLLSVLVPCFTPATCEAQTKILNVLVVLLSCKEMSSFHLPVVSLLSQLYDRPNDGAFDQTIADNLLTAVEKFCFGSDEPIVGRILVQLVPSIMTHCELRELVVSRLWSTVERIYSNTSDDHISRCCFLICGLADVFFTPGNAPVLFSANLLSSSTLWHCVQNGLQHTEALSRKRAIFILRRTLDFAGMINSSAEATAVGDSADALNSVGCLCQLSSVWHEVVILFETLEEKQVSLY